jgi:hypothetical protein
MQQATFHETASRAGRASVGVAVGRSGNEADRAQRKSDSDAGQ